MSEFDSSITAYFGGDTTGLQSAIVGAEAMVDQFGQKVAGSQELMQMNQKKWADATLANTKSIQDAEGQLAKFRDETAFSRMTTEEKLGVLRLQATGILGKINSIEENTVEKVGLQLEYEKKKGQIYDLNQKLVAEQTAELTNQNTEHKHTEGLMGQIHEWGQSIKKAFHEMGVTLHGAGIGLLFAEMIKLGREAIDNAQKQRDEYEKIGKPLDLNTASLAKFGDGLENVKHAAVSFVGAIVSGWTMMGEQLGSWINRLVGVSEAQENIAAGIQRQADAQQKITDALKAEQNDVGKIAEMRKKLAEDTRAYNYEHLDSTGKIRALIAEVQVIEEKIKNSKEGSLNAEKFRVEFVAKNAELEKATAEYIKETASIQLEHLKNVAPLSVSFRQKSADLVKEETILLNELVRLDKNSNEYRAVKNELEKNGVAQQMLARDVQQQTGLTLEEHIKKTRLLQGLDAANGEEAQRQLALLELQAKERKLQFDLTQQISENLAKNLKPEEDKRVQALIKQREEIEKQLKLLGLVVPEVKKIAEVTDEWSNNLKRASDIIAGIRGGNQFNDQSNDVLEETKRRNEQQISGLQQQDSTGGVHVGISKSNAPEIARIQAENQNIDKILSQRASVVSDLKSGGYAQALRNYSGDPTQFESFVNTALNQTTAQQKNTEYLQKIHGLLVNTLAS